MTTKSTAEHTPGPLFAQHNSDRGNSAAGEFYRVETAAGYIVADAVEKEGDAVLFAAATETAAERDRLRESNAELVMFAKKVVAWYEDAGSVDPGVNSPGSVDLWRDARAALARQAKAEGRS